MRAFAWITALAALTLAGCGTLPSDSSQSRLSALLVPAVAPSDGSGGAIPARLQDCEFNWSGGSGERALRDTCIMRLKSLIDAAYFPYRDRVLRRVERTNLSLDLGAVALGTASTAVGAAGTKTILTAIQTVLTSSKAAIGEDVLHKTTIDLIIQQMEANRAQRATELQQAMTRDDYTLEQAKNLLLKYVYEGTVEGAVPSLQTQVAVNAAKCMAAEQNAKASGPAQEAGGSGASAGCGQTITTTYEYSDLGKAIEALWLSDGLDKPPNPANEKILKTCLSKLKIDVLIPETIRTKRVTDAQRSEVLGCFHTLQP